MRLLISALVLFIGVSVASAQKERKFIRTGNKEFSNEKYIESEIEYKKALDNLGEGKSSFEAEFNLGDSYFKQEKYEEALNQFKSINQEDLTKDQKAIINTIWEILIWQKRILIMQLNSYKTALKNNPLDDDDTSYNLIVALKMKQQQEQDKQESGSK